MYYICTMYEQNILCSVCSSKEEILILCVYLGTHSEILCSVFVYSVQKNLCTNLYGQFYATYKNVAQGILAFYNRKQKTPTQKN